MTQAPRPQQDRGSFVQFPAYLIYECPELNRDDKWTLLAIMGTCWTSGPHRLSYRDIHALSGVPISLLSSFDDKKGVHHEGIMERLARLDWVTIVIGKEVNPSTGKLKGNAQTYIYINYERIWQENIAYCQRRKQSTEPYAVDDSEYQPVSHTNKVVSNTNKVVSNTNTLIEHEPVQNENTPVLNVNEPVSYTNRSVSYVNEPVSVSRSNLAPIYYPDITDQIDYGRHNGVFADAQTQAVKNLIVFEEAGKRITDNHLKIVKPPDPDPEKTQESLKGQFRQPFSITANSTMPLYPIANNGYSPPIAPVQLVPDTPSHPASQAIAPVEHITTNPSKQQGDSDNGAHADPAHRDIAPARSAEPSVEQGRLANILSASVDPTPFPVEEQTPGGATATGSSPTGNESRAPECEQYATVEAWQRARDGHMVGLRARWDGEDKLNRKQYSSRFDTYRAVMLRAWESAHPKPKRRQEDMTDDRPTLTAGGHLVYDAWCSLFKVAIPMHPSIVTAANDLHPAISEWAKALGWTPAQVLKDIMDREYRNDRKHYYQGKGVKLYDVRRGFEGWQSEQEYKLNAAQRNGTTGGVSIANQAGYANTSEQRRLEREKYARGK